MKNTFVAIFLFTLSLFLAQEQGDFRYFLDKSIGKTYNDPKQGLDFAQDLVVNDKNPNNKIIYQETIAQAYALQGDYMNAIKSLPGNEDLKTGNHSKFYQFYIDFLLADQYQNLGLYEHSEKTINKILKAGNFPENPETNITLSKIYQIHAINLAIFKKYDLAIQNFEKSDAFIKEKNEQCQIMKTQNELYRGVCLLHLKKISDAENIFNKVIASETANKYNFIYAWTREYLARVKFQQQKPQESIMLLQEALKKIENNNFATLKINIYDALSKAYLAQNKNAEYNQYQTLYNAEKSKVTASQKAATNYLVSIIEDVDSEEIASYKAEAEKMQNKAILSSIALVALLLALYFFTLRKEKEQSKQLEFFENFDKKSQSKEEKTTENVDFEKIKVTTSDEKKPALLSSEKEKELLEKLANFEKSERYLSNQMSLPVLAAELDTNIKYLSEIIRNYKQKKFNAYINDLRIQYIVNKLKTDPNYLNYKVSYLAESTGFSSHSAFTAVFKSITGMSPNDFIQQISNQKK